MNTDPTVQKKLDPDPDLELLPLHQADFFSKIVPINPLGKTFFIGLDST